MPLLPALFALTALASPPVVSDDADAAHGTDVGAVAAPAPRTRPEIALHAWVRGGYAAQLSDKGLSHGPVLSLARLQARTTHQDRYRVFLQLGADRGQVALLDARATVAVGDRLELSAGRFKQPVSHEFLIPATELLIPSRAQLVQLAPRRGIGLEATWSSPGERLTPTIRAGVFDPLKLGHTTFGGAQLVLQADLHAHSGWFVHGAGAAWIHPDDARTAYGESAPEQDAHADVAIGWVNPAWTADAELLAAHTLDGDGWLLGGGAVVARRFEAHHGDVVIEPVVAWDALQGADALTHRATAALNVHEDGWRLVQSLAWEVEIGPEAPVHLVIAQLQAGI